MEAPGKPSVVVRPFETVSEDEPVILFAQNITVDLTVSLAQFRELVVIAPLSASVHETRRDRASHDQGHELGADYVVEGSVHRESRNLLTTTGLIEAQSGRELWGKRFRYAFGDSFTKLDDLTDAIASSMIRHITIAELRRASWRRTTPN